MTVCNWTTSTISRGAGNECISAVFAEGVLYVPTYSGSSNMTLPPIHVQQEA